MFNILQLNEISPIVTKVLGDKYVLSKDVQNPEAIILRSFNMLDYAMPASLLCIARAGAGTNNIPVDSCAQKGIVVFNTPGANANAVKELAVCALLLASRSIVPAIEWARTLKGKGTDVPKLVANGKGEFAGPEIAGKRLGVIGLGAIGAQVANTAIELGMTVYGYDPYISIDGAWNLSNYVIRETDLSRLFGDCDYLSLHVPYNSATKHIIDGAAIEKMKQNVCIINCSRAELVNNGDLLAAIKSRKVARYITDFPSDELLDTENVVAIPHLGASTPEAEDNCAVMAAKQTVEFIANGNIINSVNFPRVTLPRSGKCRVTVIHENVKAMLTTLTDTVSAAKINIANMISQSQGNYAYTILDLDDDVSETELKKLRAHTGVIKVRVIR
ncbi:MAG: phosphoglycerate dehydrogenase [Clostridiales bacterium]|nr:phosphoglycerate dehydrogenase [Clostridiales bacterium]